MREASRRATTLAAIFAGAALALAACAESSEILPSGGGAGETSEFAARGGTAPEGLRRGFTRRLGGGDSGGIQVNAFLWRAALDTISFMPISSADPFGGAIITDWYAPPETPDERFKINVLVQGAELRSDGVKISLFRQTRNAAGGWTDAPAENNTSVDLENVILMRARELHQENANR